MFVLFAPFERPKHLHIHTWLAINDFNEETNKQTNKQALLNVISDPFAAVILDSLACTR